MSKIPPRLSALLALPILLGCAAMKATPRSAPAVPEPVLVQAAAEVADAEEDDEYVLQLGDVLDVKLFYNPELDETLPIRPDGRISLQLVGEVKAAGLTPAELRELLWERYSESLRRPEVAVIVKELSGRKVYVGGEVNAPGILRPVGRITALQAIFEAGGFKDSARLGNVVVLRNQGTPEPLFLTVDLRQSITGGEQADDLLLKPYDIVFVPKTRIARMNQLVDQYVRELIPISLTLGVSYLFGDNVTVR
ncbi:MAG: sugar transporter [bacterium]|nr:sugar transporter [bacterium]